MSIHYQSILGFRDGAKKLHIHLTEIPDTASHPPYQHEHMAEEAFYLLDQIAHSKPWQNGQRIRDAAASALTRAAGRADEAEKQRKSRMEARRSRIDAKRKSQIAPGRRNSTGAGPDTQSAEGKP